MKRENWEREREKETNQQQQPRRKLGDQINTAHLETNLMRIVVCLISTLILILLTAYLWVACEIKMTRSLTHLVISRGFDQNRLKSKTEKKNIQKAQNWSQPDNKIKNRT